MHKNQMEPRFVNAAQYHRMMIMRIKRARKQIQQQALQLQNKFSDKGYIYESRHKHAKNRVRTADGKFTKKNIAKNWQ